MLGLASTLFVSGLVTAPSPRVIMKFGGSSVRDAERIQEVCKLVVNQMEEEGVRPHLVCSAMGKTTNNLLAAAERAINEQVVDLSAVRDLHADTAVKLGLVASSEYADVLRLLDECARRTLALAVALAVAVAVAVAVALTLALALALALSPTPTATPTPNSNPNPKPHPEPGAEEQRALSLPLTKPKPKPTPNTQARWSSARWRASRGRGSPRRTRRRRRCPG